MEVASFVISILAAAFAGGAVWYSRGEKLAAARSADEAKRSADAAVEAIGYQREEVERNRVRFELEPVGHDAYLLRNRGTHSAYGVHVDTGGLGVEAVTDYEEFQAGQAEEYLLLQTMGATTTHVTVTWHQQADRSDEKRVTRLYVEH